MLGPYSTERAGGMTHAQKKIKKIPTCLTGFVLIGRTADADAGRVDGNVTEVLQLLICVLLPSLYKAVRGCVISGLDICPCNHHLLLLTCARQERQRGCPTLNYL